MNYLNRNQFKRISTLICLLVCTGRIQVEAKDINTPGRKILTAIEKEEIKMIEANARDQKITICGGYYPPLSTEGFQSIKDRAERLSGRCYAQQNIPTDIGLDFSSMQNYTEEFFFDSVIRHKLDQLSCRKYTLDCLEKPKFEKPLAEDFADRLNAFRIYREKMIAYDPKNNKIPNFSDSDKNILKKFFPEIDNKSPETFLKTWHPVEVATFLVNFTEANTDQSFLFQEAFANLARDEKFLSSFGNLSHDQQVQSIEALIKTSREKQRNAVESEEQYWMRACRPETNPPKTANECFFRPTIAQKRNLVSQFSIDKLTPDLMQYRRKQKTTNRSSKNAEMSFICSLKVRYGEGARLFDGKMGATLSALSIIPTTKAITAAIATRNVSASLVAGLIDKRIRFTPAMITAADTIETAGSAALALKLKHIYDVCNSGKKFTSTQKLPHLGMDTARRKLSRDQFLKSCQACTYHPNSTKTFNRNCAKETTALLITQYTPIGSAQNIAGAMSVDQSGKNFFSQAFNEMTDTLSFFYYNLSLTNNLDVPEALDFDFLSDDEE